MRIATLIVTFALLVALAQPAATQQSETFGNYEVHYNTLNTNMLSPEIASVYGIQRSGTQAMLNVTVLNRETREAVAATVDVIASNLTGQRRDIELRRIDDQGAIYYIGQFRIHDEETLNFNVSVKPSGFDGDAFELTFRQQFFTG
jgi:hypothetical protein